ncbi:MAG: hypothetical protein ACR5LA_03315 [Wolbachia sp.]
MPDIAEEPLGFALTCSIYSFLWLVLRLLNIFLNLLIWLELANLSKFLYPFRGVARIQNN